MKIFYLIIILLYSFDIIAQDSRKVLPTSVKTKTSIKYNGTKIKEKYSKKLTAHINKRYEEYGDREELRGYLKRGLNVGRNSMSFLSVALGPNLVKEIAFELGDFALEQQSKENLEAFNYNMENIAKGVIATNQDLEIDSDEFRDEVKALFFENEIKPEHYPVLGKQFDKMIFDRLLESRENLETFKSTVTDDISILIDKGLTRDKAIEEIHKKLSEKDGEIISLKNSQEEIKKNLAILEFDLNKKMNSFMDATLKWQEKVNEDMYAINNKVKKNEDKISENSKKIKTLKDELNDQGLTIDEHSIKIAKLQTLQSENRNLILSNRVRIDALGSVLYGEASTSGKIEMLKKGLVKFENNQEQKEEIDKLENIQSWEEFNRDLAMGREIVKFASNLGLDEKTAKDANKVLSALSVVGQFAVSYPSNPMGMLSAVNGAFSLFGDGQEGKPDPAIMAELAEIKQKLSEINQKIDILNEKTDALLERQYEFHIQNMRSFASLHDDIKRLEVKTDILIQLLTNDCAILQPDEYSMIETIKKRLQKKEIKLVDYNLLLMSFPNRLPKILKCIDDNTESINLSSADFILMNRINPDLEIDQFIPAITYINAIYGTTNATKSLNCLPIKTNSIWNIINNTNDINISNQESLKHLINPNDLAQLVELYLSVMPYFLLEKNHNTESYDIWLENDLKDIPQQVLIDRTNTQFNNLKRIFKLIELCFMQESLLAGNKIFQHLNNDLGKSNSNRAELAFKTIKNNQVMQLNLATFLINKNILLDEVSSNEFIKFFDEAISKEIDAESLSIWSSKLKNNWSFYQQKETKGYSLWVSSTLKVNGNDKKLILPIDLQSCLTNEVIYSSGSLFLLEAKEKIKDKLIEYDFQSFINENKETDFVKDFNSIFTE